MILAYINKTPFVRWFKRSTLTLYIGLVSVIVGVWTIKTLVVCDFKHECKWCHKICRKLFYRDVQKKVLMCPFVYLILFMFSDMIIWIIMKWRGQYSARQNLKCWKKKMNDSYYIHVYIFYEYFMIYMWTGLLTDLIPLVSVQNDW